MRTSSGGCRTTRFGSVCRAGFAPSDRTESRTHDHVGEFGENLRAPVQRFHDFECGRRLVRGDVVVDTEKPPLSLGGPLPSPRLDSTPHSSWEMVGRRRNRRAHAHHCRESKLPNDLLEGGIFRLVLDQADELLLDRTHGAILPPLQLCLTSTPRPRPSRPGPARARPRCPRRRDPAPTAASPPARCRTKPAAA